MISRTMRSREGGFGSAERARRRACDGVRGDCEDTHGAVTRSSRGVPPGRRRSEVDEAFQEFLIDLQSRRCSPKTIAWYEDQGGLHFLTWLSREGPTLATFEAITVGVMRRFREWVSTRLYLPGGARGVGDPRQLQDSSVVSSHKAVLAFLQLGGA